MRTLAYVIEHCRSKEALKHVRALATQGLTLDRIRRRDAAELFRALIIEERWTIFEAEQVYQEIVSTNVDD